MGYTEPFRCYVIMEMDTREVLSQETRSLPLLELTADIEEAERKSRTSTGGLTRYNHLYFLFQASYRSNQSLATVTMDNQWGSFSPQRMEPLHVSHLQKSCKEKENTSSVYEGDEYGTWLRAEARTSSMVLDGNKPHRSTNHSDLDAQEGTSATTDGRGNPILSKMMNSPRSGVFTAQEPRPRE
ncbi:hypothetical protein FEM48_ZijujUnG0075900 [Ziziphus jujuba var. spinosa]|uniref:Uncharacterized protein n=1 Tax=Ziziphus jujuba var. spinosa TaxID=714518 RepID=A0A978U8S2_ZIZJJ|nr:hypothetical protein FEM48_ZijujUnG0075900 [Ziziphus jujuba var. spinosa]